MKAVCYYGKADVRVENVADPEILNPRDAIVRVTATAICGSDLHIYGGYIPTMQKGDVLGHEFMGEVVDVGREQHAPEDRRPRGGAVHDRLRALLLLQGAALVAVRQLQPERLDGGEAVRLFGVGTLRLFAHVRRVSRRPGGVRAGAVCRRRPAAGAGLAHRRAGPVPLGHFPTGYMAAENCQIKPGDTVAVWGCGPVGQFAIQSAFLLGAERVIAIDRYPERLSLAASFSKAEVLDYSRVDVPDALREMTGGQGPDACIDAVGLESHGTTLDAWYDRAKTSMYLATDRPHALRQAIGACRKGGTVSIPGVYGGWLDKFPLGAAFAKGLTLKMGQTHMHRYMPRLLQHIERGDIDPSFIITHRVALEDAPEMYETFRAKQDACVKVVMKPGAAARPATAH